ncbi:TPA: restriction endonuclease subunit S [Serratia odorifera]|nr:restriction endonuclease subunit S [Serratia odorifera]
MSKYQLVTLGKHIDILSGCAFPSSGFNQQNGVPLIRIRDILSGRTETYYEGSYDLKYLIKKGDLLVGMDGDFNREYWKGTDALLNQRVCKITSNPETLDKNFLYHFLQKELDKIHATTDVVTVKHLSVKKIQDIKIRLPSLKEQKRIAAILDKADGIRQKREQAIKLADDFLRTKFLEMFYNEKIKRYPITKVNDLLAQEKNSIRTGPFGSQLLHSEFTESGIAVLGIDNAVKNEFQWGKPRFISQSKYETLKRYTVFPGDVIITIMGTCGRCAVVPDNIPTAINTKHLCCISLDKSKCIPEFLHSYFLIHPLAKEYLAKHSKGAIMDGLNMGVIKHMPFPEFPLEQQYEFVNIKEKIKKLKIKLNSSKIDCEYKFTTLCNDIFNMQG